jgi:uncharacterized damage-inducible protein DinB
MADSKQAILDDLAAAHAEASAVMQRLRPEQLVRPTENPDWSARDLIAHLASIEGRLRAMWQHALDGGAGPAPEPSLDEYNAACVAERRGRSLDALTREFQREGDTTRTFVEDLPTERLSERWSHSVRGDVTIESLLWIAPRHLREHVAQLAAATAE